MLGRGEIKNILAKYEVAPSRALGQNFLSDPNVANKIVKLASVGSQDWVLEIGPGVGSLTAALAGQARKVLAIELDRYLIPAIEETVERLGLSNVTVIQGDAMKVDFNTLLSASNAWKLVANLPYNISTPLVINLLESCEQISEMMVMVQKEVGERMCAVPGSSVFSGVALKVGYFARARIVSSISREVFIPKPNVDSVLVQVVRREPIELDLDPDLYKKVFSISRVAFANRRQMIRRTLSSYLSSDDFEELGIDPTRRPETLNLNEWKVIADKVTTEVS